MKRLRAPIYKAIIPGQEVKEGLTYYIKAVEKSGQYSVFPEKGIEKPAAITVTSDNKPPEVIHEHISIIPAGKSLKISALVKDISGIKWVRLRYRSVTQFEDYRTLKMLPSDRQDQYQAEVPGEHITSKWDFMYLIEVMDNKGNGRIYPDLDKETPYIIVKIKR